MFWSVLPAAEHRGGGAEESEQQGLGAYIQDGWTLSEAFSLQLGLRGDTFSFVSEDDPNWTGEPFDETDSAVSGNVGLTWSVTDHVNLTGLVARGFRTPNLQERSFFGLATNGEAYILQNPGLSSESSWNYEIGTKVRYDRYSGGFHFFYNDLSDFITLEFLESGDPRCTSPPAPPGVQCAQFANIEKATIWGAELDLEAMIGDVVDGLRVPRLHGRRQQEHQRAAVDDPAAEDRARRAATSVRGGGPRRTCAFSIARPIFRRMTRSSIPELSASPSMTFAEDTTSTSGSVSWWRSRTSPTSSTTSPSTTARNRDVICG